MLSESEIKEIKEHLEKAQNPVFFYDNDADGLCSFLLLRRFLERGKGVAVRSYPELNVSYAKRAKELEADYVFVLDKPVISKSFVKELDEMHLPLVWIDHHKMEQDWKADEFTQVWIYNSFKEGSGEPVTFVCFKISGREEDLWIAVMGCIADHYMPAFAEKFGEKYSSFWGKVKDPFEAYYKTEIGKIALSLNFGLKDSTSNIVKMQNFFVLCRGPEEVFLETKENSAFRHKYNEIRKKYQSLIERAQKQAEKKMIYFEYSGDLSISSELSNELSYFNPEKYIVVVFKKGTLANISMRGKNVRKILLEIIKEMSGASGGGHEEAVGARIRAEDLVRFKRALEEKIK